MPAVTAPTETLSRITVAPGARPRPVRSVTVAPSSFEGEGFPVRRAFAGVSLADLDPFIHMDQMGEVDYAPYEPRGTSWHPHRGFETVTYMIDGTIVHQDSHGGGGVIRDGATQWMTAGRGILHIETPPEQLVISGGRFHGVQLWVNLPAVDKMIDPAYQDLAAADVRLFASADGASLIRLIAGRIGEHHGPGRTRTPITLAHVTVAPGSRVEIPWPEDFNALAFALAGAGRVGDEADLALGRLAVMGAGETIAVSAESVALDVLLLGGRPIGEPISTYGPFVMNTRAEIVQALEDYQSGRLGTVPPDGIQPYYGRRH